MVNLWIRNYFVPNITSPLEFALVQSENNVASCDWQAPKKHSEKKDPPSESEPHAVHYESLKPTECEVVDEELLDEQ